MTFQTVQEVNLVFSMRLERVVGSVEIAGLSTQLILSRWSWIDRRGMTVFS